MPDKFTTRYMVEVTYPGGFMEGEPHTTHTAIVALFHRVAEDLAKDRPEWTIATYVPASGPIPEEQAKPDNIANRAEPDGTVETFGQATDRFINEMKGQ